MFNSFLIIPICSKTFIVSLILLFVSISATINAEINSSGEISFHITNNYYHYGIELRMELVSPFCWDTETKNITTDYPGGTISAYNSQEVDIEFRAMWKGSVDAQFALGKYKFTLIINDVQKDYCIIDYRTATLSTHPFIDLKIEVDASTGGIFKKPDGTNFPMSTTIWNQIPAVGYSTLGLEVYPPDNLRQTATIGHPNLEWDPLSDDMYRTGYDIYQQFYPEFGFSKIGSVSANSNCYVDNTISIPPPGQSLGCPISYYVKAINGVNVESDSSNNVSIRIHGNYPYKLKPSTPDAQPHDFFLSQCFPNPFNPSTNIKYYLPEKTRVEIKVYDNMGREIEKLVSDKKIRENM
ncbi:MAG: hypothetical protein P4L35_04035 [Ignavibacteriaceae bacterium]|nr:hypothetical protein [Ignavibacteriaceae bacterium]